jgi:ferrous iron transport protein A
MPLTMLSPGKESVIEVCRAKDTTKKFLEGLGIIPGVTISVVSEFSGNLIVTIKGAVKKRLMDMGGTRGAEVLVRKVAPLGDPMEVNIRGYELTLRKIEAENIMVE